MVNLKSANRILASLILFAIAITFISASPVVSMYLGESSGVHNDATHSLIVYATFWNQDNSYQITSCEVSWDGVNFESVDKGTEGNWYSISHTFESAGLQTVFYRCQNSRGVWSDVNELHRSYDSINIELLPPSVSIFVGEEIGEHNDNIFSRTVYANVWQKDNFYPVVACQISWDGGTNWEFVNHQISGETYSVQHRYDDFGYKKILYRCENSLGFWNYPDVKHVGYDDLTIHPNTELGPQITIIKPTEGQLFNSTNVNLAVTSTQDVTCLYTLNNQSEVEFNHLEEVTMQASEGSNYLEVFCSNSAGYDLKTVNFKVNTSVEDTTAPIISNITTDPVMPFINNGDSQDLVIDFVSSEYPLFVKFEIHNNTTIFYTQTADLENSSILPFILHIPNNLTDGEYHLTLHASDIFGNTASYHIGMFSVKEDSDDDEDDDDEEDEDDDESNRRRSSDDLYADLYEDSIIDLSKGNNSTLIIKPESKGQYSSSFWLWLILALIVLIIVALILIAIII
jgi:hypothetical protein